MRVNALGQIVAECWNALPTHFPNVELDAFVIMPNHIHGVIVIVDAVPSRKGEAFSRLPNKRENATTTRHITGFAWRNHPEFQIGFDTQDQRVTPDRWRARVASEFLRAYHPRRKIAERDSPLHRKQSDELGTRRGKSE